MTYKLLVDPTVTSVIVPAVLIVASSFSSETYL